CPACGKPVEDRRSTMSTLAPTAGDHASVDKAWEETRRRLDDATAGQYEIMKELGRGGFAVVYLGHEVSLSRKVAIKVMSPGLLTSASMVTRFKQEAVTVAGLNHPNIISIYTVQQFENLHY